MRISDWSSDVCSSDLLLGVEIEGAADVAEANRRFLVDAQGAATLETALDDDAAARELEVDRGGDGIQSAAAARGHRPPQHVAGAGLRHGSPSRPQQPGLPPPPPGLHLPPAASLPAPPR